METGSDELNLSLSLTEPDCPISEPEPRFPHDEPKPETEMHCNFFIKTSLFIIFQIHV